MPGAKKTHGKFDLNLLRVFDVLYEQRSVTRAADKLGLTQSAVSNALGRLRRAFDDGLFVRSAGGLMPTAVADSLAGPIRHALDEVEQALRDSRSFNPATISATYSIKTSDHWIPLLSHILLPALAREAPNMCLEITPYGAESYGELGLGDLDILMTYLIGNPPENLKVRYLFSERAAAMVRRGSPLDKAGITLENYAAADHIVLRPRGAWSSSPVDASLRQHGYERHVKILVSSFLSMAELVEAGDLVASLPEFIARRFERTHKVTYYPLPMAVPMVDVGLIWHERAHHDPAHQWLRNLIGENAARVGAVAQGGA